MPRRLIFALTAHGLGHATRSCALANALWRLDPGLEIEFWADLPRHVLEVELSGAWQHRVEAFEPGVLQRGAFAIDAAGTVSAYSLLSDSLEPACDRLAQRLADSGARAVVSDAPAIVCAAAARAGIPVVVISNFTWDWVLEPLLAATPASAALDWISAAYQHAGLHLQLPFGPRESPVPRLERQEVISRRARESPLKTRERLGLESTMARPLAVVCAGGWSVEDWPVIHADVADLDLVLVGDPPVEVSGRAVRLPHNLPVTLSVPELVAAADVVLAKPGYGIASECLSHATPLVSIERPGFREAPVLEAEFAARGKFARIRLADFFAGRWSSALESARSDPTDWILPPEDALIMLAERLLSWAG
jgi:hypothetical protein